MVKTALAFADQPGIKEFKVVSTGTDVAAQLGATEDSSTKLRRDRHHSGRARRF